MSIFRKSSMKKLSSFIPKLLTISKWWALIFSYFFYHWHASIKIECCFRMTIWHYRCFTRCFTIFFFLPALTTTSYMETGPSAISEVKNICKYLFYPMTPRISFLAHSLCISLHMHFSSFYWSDLLMLRCSLECYNLDALFLNWKFPFDRKAVCDGKRAILIEPLWPKVRFFSD